MSENLVFKEFEETPKKIVEYECNVARLPDNTSRNRFRDVLPYDGTRVKLTPRKDNSSGYINASHIKVGTFSIETTFIIPIPCLVTIFILTLILPINSVLKMLPAFYVCCIQ